MSKRYTRVNVVPEYSHGDLVTADGYEGDVLKVESYTIEAHRHADSEWNYDCVVYDLTSVITGDMAIAEQNDMTLVADVAQSDEYLSANKLEISKPFDITDYDDPFVNMIMVSKKVTKPVESNHRSEEKAEISRRKNYRNKVNELLDQYNKSLREDEINLATSILNELEMRAVIFNEGGIWEEADSQ